MKTLKHLIIALLLLVPISKIHAVPIITSSGTPGTLSNITNTQYNAIEFILNDALDNAAIEAILTSGTLGRTGTAFLTTQIGFGTTVTDVIASANFTFATTNSVYVPLFSGLSLEADTYYLVFSTDGDGGGIPFGATYTLDSIASVGSMFFSDSSNIDPFAPASNWFESGLGNRYFNLTGDISAVSAPTTLALLGLSLVALRLFRKTHY
jgi:hypothetical protein